MGGGGGLNQLVSSRAAHKAIPFHSHIYLLLLSRIPNIVILEVFSMAPKIAVIVHNEQALFLRVVPSPAPIVRCIVEGMGDVGVSGRFHDDPRLSPRVTVP